jgi:hypothetical protein
VISGAAFCPQPQLLLPDVAVGAAAELDGLRAACRTAIERVGTGRQLVLLGAGPVSRSFPPQARGTLAAFGVAGELALGVPEPDSAAADLPPALTVGAWLVRDALGPDTGAVAFAVGPDFAAHPAARELHELAGARDVALLVLGDGSARRSLAAPGYLDERAEAFDAAVEAALAGGDGAALRALDGALGAELLAAGVPAWHAAGRLLEGTAYAGTVLYAEAPYGVGYFAAAWTAGG